MVNGWMGGQGLDLDGGQEKGCLERHGSWASGCMREGGPVSQAQILTCQAKELGLKSWGGVGASSFLGIKTMPGPIMEPLRAELREQDLAQGEGMNRGPQAM